MYYVLVASTVGPFAFGMVLEVSKGPFNHQHSTKCQKESSTKQSLGKGGLPCAKVKGTALVTT